MPLQVETFLRFAGLAYTKQRTDAFKAPKKKVGLWRQLVGSRSAHLKKTAKGEFF
jgi:hypothetical protein